MNQDERRALKIVKERLPAGAEIEHLFKEFLKMKDEDLTTSMTAVEVYYPKPEEIADAFIKFHEKNLNVM